MKIAIGLMVCVFGLVAGCGQLDEPADGRDRGNAHHTVAESIAITATCGDGNLDVGEQCDDGNTAAHDGCSATCTLELVAQFAFTGAAGTETTFAADLVDPALAATPAMSRGTGVTPSAAADAFSASAWTTSTAIDTTDFYRFTVTPAAGKAMNLLALQLDERRSATGIRSWSIRSSLDAFASDLAVFMVPDDTLTRTERATLPAQFRNLTTPVEFRIFGFGSEAATGTWRLDNVELIGEVVPACGNGIVDAGEQCDDGNTASGDGCENTCKITSVTYLKASNTSSNDIFGSHVALSADGSTMVVAADGEDSAATGINGNQADNTAQNAGAVYVFIRSGTIWQQQAYIKPSNTGALDSFSFSLALSADGSTLAVGAFAEDSSATGINGNQASDASTDAGAVYVFTRSGTTWSQQAYVKASNTNAGDEFGFSVALSSDGSTMAVGAIHEDSSATGINGNQTNDLASNSGAVYVFTRSGTTWSQQAYVKASNTEAGDAFGSDVALSSDGATLAVGADGEDSAATGVNGNQADNSAGGSGAAYIFTRSAGVWSQQAYVKASNPNSGDDFGHDLVLSSDGSTLAVGASLEASAATGINGNQADNSATFAGAAYVFARSGATWSQQAYVKASNTNAGDRFGISLALSSNGSQLAVGAPLESGSTTGINGDQTNNAASDAGAAYRFVRSGSTWSQSAYVKASNTGMNDEFGFSVALTADGSAMAVGALAEASSATGIGGNQANDSAFQAGAVYVYQ
jgi:cysteine-rich repeat protein